MLLHIICSLINWLLSWFDSFYPTEMLNEGFSQASLDFPERSLEHTHFSLWGVGLLIHRELIYNTCCKNKNYFMVKLLFVFNEMLEMVLKCITWFFGSLLSAGSSMVSNFVYLSVRRFSQKQLIRFFWYFVRCQRSVIIKSWHSVFL